MSGCVRASNAFAEFANSGAEGRELNSGFVPTNATHIRIRTHGDTQYIGRRERQAAGHDTGPKHTQTPAAAAAA